jgi:hypothetical protein
LNKVKIISSFIAFFSLIFCVNVLIAQNTLDSDKMLVLKVGNGTTFGGKGIGAEFRKNRLGAQLDFGFRVKEVQDSLTTPSSYNFNLNAFYYFRDPKSAIRPKLGIHLGWLNNYNDNQIVTKKYNPHVYGMAFVSGLEFGEGIVKVSINVIYDPGFLIFKPETHPYYSDLYYLSYSFGVGIDLVGFNKFIKNRKIIKKYDKNQKENDENENDENSTTLNKNNTIKDKCFSLSEISGNIAKGICGENTIYQQISSDKFVLIEFTRNISDYKGTNIFDVKDNAFVKVYIISGADYNDFCSVIDKTTNYIKADEGKTTLLVEQNNENKDILNISVMLKGISVSSKIENETRIQIYDEIVICNLNY